MAYDQLWERKMELKKRRARRTEEEIFTIFLKKIDGRK